MRFGRKIIAADIVCLIALNAAGIAQPLQINASVNPDELSAGERFTYTVKLSGGSGLPDVELPDLSAFDVVMGPSASSSIQIINGRTTHEKTVMFILRARSPGRRTIGAARVKVGRNWYSSGTVTVNILPAGQSRPSSPGGSSASPAPVTRDGELPDVFIVARADKQRAYSMEMVTVTYQLYLNVNVTSYNFVRLPKATGFLQEEFPTSNNPPVRDATVRGTPYKVADIRKVVLFPTRTGTLTLDPLTCDVTVELPERRRRRDIFDPFFSRRRREVRTVSTDPLSILVNNLPIEGRPANFHGDVGDYNLRMTFDRRELAQHDALTVKITISGTGYLKSIDPPQLNLPPGFEAFDPTVSESISLRGGKMTGSKSFTYLVIPRRSGKFTLDGLEFSYFDPDAVAYRTTRAPGINLDVLPSEGEILGGASGGPAEVAVYGSDIRFIKELSTPLRMVGKPAYASVWFYVSFAASPLMFLLGLGFESILARRSADPQAVRRRRAPERMRKALANAKKHLRATMFDAAAVEAGKGLTELAAAIIGEPTAGLTSDVLAAKLREKGADDDLNAEVISLLREADCIRFSGGPLDGKGAALLLGRCKSAAAGLERLQ